MMSGVLLEFYILHVYAKIEIIRKTIITSHSQSRFLTDTYEIGLRPCDVQGKGKGDEWIGCHAADVRLYISTARSKYNWNKALYTFLQFSLTIHNKYK